MVIIYMGIRSSAELGYLHACNECNGNVRGRCFGWICSRWIAGHRPALYCRNCRRFVSKYIFSVVSFSFRNNIHFHIFFFKNYQCPRHDNNHHDADCTDRYADFVCSALLHITKRGHLWSYLVAYIVCIGIRLLSRYTLSIAQRVQKGGKHHHDSFRHINIQMV